jgi:acyl-CoA synthetase (AMP-forming)/AMP-acid ligase II
VYLTQGLHRSVRQTPGATATVFGERRRTFAESADRIARFAGALAGLGVRTGDRVATYALNSDLYHEALLAVLWAGAVVNPVNIRWNPNEVAYSLEDSGTTVLLVDAAFAGVVPELRAKVPGLRTVIHFGDGPVPGGLLTYEDLVSGAEPAEDALRGGDELAGIFYTGGTTGFPKGVMLSHANMLTAALGSLCSNAFLGRDGTYLHAAPMFHLGDLAFWVGQLVLGGAHVFVPAFDPVGVAEVISQHGVTHASLVPTMIQRMVDHPEVTRYDLSSVRGVVYGSSPMPEAVLTKAGETFPSAGFTHAYGMTELGPMTSFLLPGEHGVASLRRSAGRPAVHAEIRIVDPDGAEVRPGTIGEITVRGGHVMLGYWNKPAETAATVRDGWLHTGDGGYLDEQGYLFIVDRIKDMIISGGENIYSAEVENVLTQHPGVAACAVIGLPDADWGERVHAVVLAAADRPRPTAAELRAYCKERIAGYKCPRSVAFVDALPLSGAGKILKRELRERYLAEAA